MTLRDRLNLAFMQNLVRTPEGRKHVLAQVADAESAGEARIFDALLARVDDPALARMIRKHQADELRHEALFRACLARQGEPAPDLPATLRMMDRLDRALGGFFERPIEDGRGILEAYLVLQVIEERAATHFGLFARAFSGVDPETARVFELVARDEERHLRYCRAVASRYAPDRATHLRALARLRRIESEVFLENQRANMRHVMARRYVAGAPARAFWRVIGGLARFLPEPALAASLRAPSHGEAGLRAALG